MQRAQPFEPPWLTKEVGLTVALVTAAGLALRLAMLATLPLVVTPDGSTVPEGRGYLVWADEILRAGNLAGPALRTPGYPLLVAASYATFGVEDRAVLWLQHLEGLATVALLTLVAARVAGARVALATGMLAALDPWHLLFAHYGLTEATITFFTVSTAAAALLPSRAHLRQGLVVGLLAAGTCLVRPTAQLLLPFLAAACLLARQRRLPWAAAGLALGLTLGLGPWLAFNAARGIRGLASQEEDVLFVSMVLHRMLDARLMPEDTPAPVRRAFVEMLSPEADPQLSHEFLSVCRASGLSPEQRREWRRRTLAADPARYLEAVWDTLRWLLGVGLRGHPPVPDEVLHFVVRLGNAEPGAALAWIGLPDAVTRVEPRGRPGELVHAALARSFLAASDARGIPQLPLAGLALLALALALYRRWLREAAILAGSLAFLVAHAVLLYPLQRLALPSQMVWYLALPVLAAGFRRHHQV